MHIRDIFAAHRTTVSFEFFPPNSDAASEALFGTIWHRDALSPVQREMITLSTLIAPGWWTRFPGSQACSSFLQGG